MSDLTCDLRVLVRFSDGTHGAYAVDAIPSAARLRDELDVAGTVFSDPEVKADMAPAPEYADMFARVQSLLTRERA